MNNSFRRATAFLVSLLLTASSHAQTPLDQAKTQIWCATAKFVYEDTGVPNLKSALNCGGSLADFEKSIKADKQSVYSLLYKPLEKRGSIYKGLTTDQARLNKLANEIIAKLRKPERLNDPVKLQRLTALSTVLNSVVEDGVIPAGDSPAPEANLPAEETEAMTALPVTQSDETAAGNSQPLAGANDSALAADPDMAAFDEDVPSAPRPRAAESTMSKLFAPIALVFSLLSLVLFVLQRGQIKALNARAERHRGELEAVKLAAPGGAGSAKKLTPELQRDIEKLIEQRVAAALAQTLPAAQNLPPKPAISTNSSSAPARPAAPAPVASTAAAAPAAPLAAAAVAPASPVASATSVAAAAVAPAPAPPIRQEAPAPPPAPAYAAPAPLAEAQIAPPASVIPAGPPAAAPRDDFDSLVPPVQLPAPDTWAVVAPLTSRQEDQSGTPSPSRYYVKVPVNGGFSDYDLQEQPQHDSIYEIKVNTQHPERATFRVTSNTAVHAYAIQSAQYSLREACRYQQPSNPVSRIVTDEEGTLFKSNGAWQIEQKAAIHFE